MQTSYRINDNFFWGFLMSKKLIFSISIFLGMTGMEPPAEFTASLYDRTVGRVMAKEPNFDSELADYFRRIGLEGLTTSWIRLLIFYCDRIMFHWKTTKNLIFIMPCVKRNLTSKRN